MHDKLLQIIKELLDELEQKKPRIYQKVEKRMLRFMNYIRRQLEK
jgi:hypothetical protein